MSILGLVIILVIFLLIFYRISVKTETELKGLLQIITSQEITLIMNDFKNLLLIKPINIIYLIILIIILTPTIFTMIFIGLLDIIKNFFFFIYYLILIRYKKKTYYIIKYEEWKTKFKNFYIILFKKLFIERTRVISFYLFYNIIKVSLEKKEKIEFFYTLIIVWNVFLRIVIIIITKTPYVILKNSMYALIKLDIIMYSHPELKNTNLIKYTIVQILIDTDSEINSIIKRLKIKIFKKKIKLNFKYS